MNSVPCSAWASRRRASASSAGNGMPMRRPRWLCCCGRGRSLGNPATAARRPGGKPSSPVDAHARRHPSIGVARPQSRRTGSATPPARGLIMPKRGVDADQFVHQDLHRPAIGDDVVKSQHQHAFVRRQRQQQDPQQRSALQVERPMGLGFHQPLQVFAGHGGRRSSMAIGSVGWMTCRGAPSCSTKVVRSVSWRCTSRSRAPCRASRRSGPFRRNATGML